MKILILILSIVSVLSIGITVFGNEPVDFNQKVINNSIPDYDEKELETDKLNVNFSPG